MSRRLLFLVLLAAAVILTDRIAEQYPWQVDLSAQRINSLSDSAKQAMDALSARLEITAITPDYPVQRAQLEQLLAPYLAHHSKPRFEFVDPVRAPDRARELGAERHGELQLRSGDRLEVIAEPDAASIDLALNRLALHGERWIVTLEGNGERGLDDSPGGIARLVQHVERLGYRIVPVDPRNVDSLPENTAVLLVAGPRQAYPEHSLQLIRRYLAAGGSLLWLAGEDLPTWLATELRVEMLPGSLVDAAAATHGLDEPDNAIVSVYPAELLPRAPQRHSVFKGARALSLHEDGGDWQLQGRLSSSPRSWNETGELRGQIARDPELDERAGPLDVVLALHKTGAERQRLVLVGGSQFVANDHVGQGDNLALAVGLLRWLSDDAQLGPTRVAGDLHIDWSPRLAAVLAIGLMGVLPALYLATGLWLRYRRRRA
jgi:hypothetical protein